MALVSLPILIKVGLGLALIISFYHALRVHITRTSRLAVVGLSEVSGNTALRMWKQEEWQPCTVRARFVHPYVVILLLERPAKRWPVNVVILPDAVDKAAFHQLRVRLTLQALARD